MATHHTGTMAMEVELTRWTHITTLQPIWMALLQTSIKQHDNHGKDPPTETTPRSKATLMDLRLASITRSILHMLKNITDMPISLTLRSRSTITRSTTRSITNTIIRWSNQKLASHGLEEQIRISHTGTNWQINHSGPMETEAVLKRWMPTAISNSGPKMKQISTRRQDSHGSRVKMRLTQPQLATQWA